jgi:hypothetical protein
MNPDGGRNDPRTRLQWSQSHLKETNQMTSKYRNLINRTMAIPSGPCTPSSTSARSGFICPRVAYARSCQQKNI